MKCTKCGAEVNGKFCPECGAKAEENAPRPLGNAGKPKKPFYKRWWFAVLVIIVILIAGGKIMGGQKEKQDALDEAELEQSVKELQSLTAELKKEDDKAETTTTTKVAATTTAKQEVSGGLRKDFKEAMDAYEDFMDEYVAFMKKYSDSNGTDISLLADYAKFMSNYAEMVEKFEAWEDNDLNNEELLYYYDVQTKVSKKLLEVAITQ